MPGTTPQSRIASAILFIVGVLAASMTCVALGIDWNYVVIDQQIDAITITDLCVRDVSKNKWTRSIYEQCLKSASVFALGSATDAADCKDLTLRDSCAYHSRAMGHTVASFTIITTVVTIGVCALLLVSFFIPINLLFAAVLFFVGACTSILAWAPFVAYRYGSVPGCPTIRGKSWCTDGATKCRYYGFGFVVTVHLLCIIGTILSFVLRSVLLRQSAAKPATS